MTLDRQTLRKESLDALRFPLAIIVVIVHVFSGNDIFGWKGSDYPIFENLNNFVTAFLKGISVPIYFFISGYVFFITKNGSFSKEVYYEKIKNRVKTLFIPYIIWNGIAIILELIKLLPPFANLLGNTIESNITLKNLISAFWMYGGQLTSQSSGISVYPINHALWFIRDLMIVVVCSPLIHLCIRKTKLAGLFILSIIYIYAPYSTYMHLPQLSTAFLFFSIGAYLSIYSIDIVLLCKKIVYPALALYLMNSTIFYYYSDVHFVKTINTFVCIPMAFGIAAKIIEKYKIRSNTFLSSASFFIYISHCLIVRKIKIALFYIFTPSTGGEAILIYLLTLLITIVLLLLSFALMKKYTPSLLKVIAGRK